MFRKTLTLGVVPVKRASRDMQFANAQKVQIMEIIRKIRPDIVKIVDIDELSENGIAFRLDVVPGIIEKLRKADIDALFIPFCDFGEESVVAEIASAFKVPTLIWGSRDEYPNTLKRRGPDTQCGMFAATKVLARRNVKYSYIYNVRKDSDEFAKGYLNFIRFANVIKDLSGLTIAKIGNRPLTFWSVVSNEAELLTKMNIKVVPIGTNAVIGRAVEQRREKGGKYLSYLESLRKRFDTSAMTEELLEKSAALKAAVEEAIAGVDASVCAFGCWSEFSASYGVTPCVLVGDLTDEGIPISCECDINGAVTMAILRAANLYDESVFLADLTIRNPDRENSELLWHCGPFPYSLKADSSGASLVDGQEQFRLKDGSLTLCRFDDLDGRYFLFAGEGESRSLDGPATSGTYTYLEVDDWKRWEEKFIFGPYIHHVGGVYGKYLPVLREAARYLGIWFDDAREQGTYSL